MCTWCGRVEHRAVTLHWRWNSCIQCRPSLTCQGSGSLSSLPGSSTWPCWLCFGQCCDACSHSCLGTRSSSQSNAELQLTNHINTNRKCLLNFLFFVFFSWYSLSKSYTCSSVVHATQMDRVRNRLCNHSLVHVSCRTIHAMIK